MTPLEPASTGRLMQFGLEGVEPVTKSVGAVALADCTEGAQAVAGAEGEGAAIAADEECLGRYGLGEGAEPDIGGGGIAGTPGRPGWTPYAPIVEARP